MIANLTRGRGFRGLLNYLFQDGKDAAIVGGNMLGRSAKELVREFAACRQANDRVKTPVWHCSLSLPLGEDLIPKRWNQVGASLLAKMGLDQNRPWVLVRHSDTDHRHAHLVTSRTAYDGSVWYGHWEVNRLMQAKSEVEREFGLSVTPINSEAPKPTRGKLWELSRSIESGKDIAIPSKSTLMAAIDRAINESGGDVQAFGNRLEGAGIEMKLNQSNTTGRIAGASFRDRCGGDWLKGSQLGKAYTWAQIAGRIAACAEQQPTIEHETKRTETEPIGLGRTKTGKRIAPNGDPIPPGTNTDSRRETGCRENRAPGNDAITAIEFPNFTAFGPNVSGRVAAPEFPEAGGTNRGDGASPARVHLSKQSSTLDVVRVVIETFVAAIAALARFAKPRRQSHQNFEVPERETAPNLRSAPSRILQEISMQ